MLHHNTISITQEEWLSHFSKLFDCESDGVANSDRLEDISADDVTCDSLDCDITEPEVWDAIESLKSGKAPGPDGFNGQFYKYSAPCAIAFLHSFIHSFVHSIHW